MSTGLGILGCQARCSNLELQCSGPLLLKKSGSSLILSAIEQSQAEHTVESTSHDGKWQEQGHEHGES